MIPQSICSHSQITTQFFSSESTQSACPQDVLRKIFYLLTTIKDFKSFAGASKYLNSISMSIPIQTVASSSVRAYLYSKALYHHPKFNEVSEKIFQLYLERTKAEEELMLVLRDYGKELHIDPNSSDVMHFYNAASKDICKFFQSQVTPVQSEMKAILDSVFENCNYAMITTYANQPAEAITMESYRNKSQELRHVFHKKNAVAVEATLRQALKARHKEAFLRRSDECLSPDAKITILPLIQEQLRIEIETMKADFENEIAALLRSIDEAALQMNEAERQFQIEELDYKKNCGQKSRTSWGNSFSEKLVYYQTIASKDDDASAQTRLIQLLQQAMSAQEQKNEFQNKLNKLAKYDINGNLISGKLTSLLTSLEPLCLEDAAKRKLKRMGLFYFELAQTINEKNQYQRYRILHGKNILGSKRKEQEMIFKK